MRMKMIAWAVAIILVIVWVFPVAYANLLTAIVGDEFANTEEIGFTGMHPWEGEPDFRVLSYSKNVAKVYYFSDTGGEKALFTRENGVWNYERSTKAWSAVGGTADDYLIWPYFKDWVI